MSDKSTIVLLPDEVAINRQTILQSALYFDEVYLQALAIDLSEYSDKNSKIDFRQFSVHSDLKILRDAGVLRPLPKEVPFLVPHIDLKEKTSLREKVTASMEAGLSLPAVISIVPDIPNFTEGEFSTYFPASTEYISLPYKTKVFLLKQDKSCASWQC